MKQLAILVLGLLVLGGCRTTAPPPEEVIQQQVMAIRSTVTIGMSFAFDKVLEERVIQIKTLVDDSIIPLLEGENLGSVTRSVADQALYMLSDKLDQREKEMIQEGINLVLTFVRLPENPTTKISDADRRRILALFDGVSRAAAIVLDTTVDLTPPPRLSYGIDPNLRLISDLVWEIK